jgi:hypothetical protein
MDQKNILRAVVLFVGLVGLVEFDRGPLVSETYAQRPNNSRDDDDDEGGDRGGERFRGRGRGGFGGGGGQWGEGGPRWGGRGRGGRGFGGDGEGGGERQRRRDNDDNDEDRSNRDDGDDSRPSPMEFAQQIVKRNDKNGNNMLEGEELQGLRGPMAGADANGDKTVTAEEIVAVISNRNVASNSRSDGDRGSRGSRSGGTSSEKAAAADGNGSKVYLGLAAVMSALSDEKAKNDESSKRKTFRFTPAGERLPDGVPSWFTSRDKNKDGQIAMSEYRSSWSASAVRDFQRLDVNNDGVITAKEAAD